METDPRPGLVGSAVVEVDHLTCALLKVHHQKPVARTIVDSGLVRERRGEAGDLKVESPGAG